MNRSWRLWVIGGVVTSLVGCNGFGKKNSFPEVPRQTARVQQEVDEPAQKGPLKPDTVLAFGNAMLDAADPIYPRSTAERDRLLVGAQNHFKTVLEQQPQNTLALAGMGRASFYLGDREGAVSNYRKAIETEPRNARLWFELASVQSKLMRDYGAASQSLTEAYRIEPDNLVYRRWLGRTLALSGRTEEGVSLLKLNQPEAEVRFELAEMLHLIGRDDLSRQQLQLALRADPSFTLASDVLAEFGTPFTGREVQPARYEMPIYDAEPKSSKPAATIRPVEPQPLVGSR